MPADLIATHTLAPDHPDAQQIYCGLDTTVTFEVWEVLQSLAGPSGPPLVYNFERALQAPALEMMLRGWKIDQYERDRVLVKLKADKARLQHVLDRLAGAVWDFRYKDSAKAEHVLNPRSGDQLKRFFYGQTFDDEKDAKLQVPHHLHLEPIWSSEKGVRGVRMNRDSLEKLEAYYYARPFAATIMAIRDLDKKEDVLETGLDPDGYIRTSINVGATETGRFSSSKSPLGTGGNLFNISEDMRRPFIADPGWKLCGIDLEQAESREVGWIIGNLFDDWTYLDAVEAGDIHTYVARLVWPELGWTGDLKLDKEIAEQGFYRHYSYRYIAKRGGHATNYLMTPFTAARQLKVPQKIFEDFQRNYFAGFSGIPKWHRWVAEQLQTKQTLNTPFGRERQFFGRPNDDATLREAVAYVPQSSTADRLNIGLLRLWQTMGKRVRVMLQLYDAIYFQFREDDDEQEICKLALDCLSIPLSAAGRTFNVPGEAKTGWNWASYVGQSDVDKAKAKGEKPPELNLDGLRKIKFGQADARKRQTILERIL